MVDSRRHCRPVYVGSIRDGLMNMLADRKEEDKKPCNVFKPAATRFGLFNRDCVLGKSHDGDHVLPDGTVFRDGVVK